REKQENGRGRQTPTPCLDRRAGPQSCAARRRARARRPAASGIHAPGHLVRDLAGRAIARRVPRAFRGYPAGGAPAGGSGRDRRGPVLVKSGRMTEAQLQEQLHVQKSNLKRMGSILVENNFIDAVALREALQVNISQMVYRLFSWADGEYDFSQKERVEYDKE